MKEPKEKKISDKLLRPLRRHVAETRGALTIVAFEMTKKLGRQVTRQQVSGWLMEGEKRNEPGLGMGTVLVAVGNKVMGK